MCSGKKPVQKCDTSISCQVHCVLVHFYCTSVSHQWWKTLRRYICSNKCLIPSLFWGLAWTANGGTTLYVEARGLLGLLGWVARSAGAWKKRVGLDGPGYQADYWARKNCKFIRESDFGFLGLMIVCQIFGNFCLLQVDFPVAGRSGALSLGWTKRIKTQKLSEQNWNMKWWVTPTIWIHRWQCHQRQAPHIPHPKSGIRSGGFSLVGFCKLVCLPCEVWNRG